MKYYVSQGVQAYYGDDWYDGTVKKANADGTYCIHFNDGYVLEDAIESEIRLPIGDIAIDDISKILTEIKRLEAEKGTSIVIYTYRLTQYLLQLPRHRVL